ncbi:MAG: Serine/threonine exchanger SteT [Planctomycetota bacterium]|jgi:amino acid transporter
MSETTANASKSELKQHFNLVQATALNISMVVGAGVFVTIPLMLAHLPGPLALLGWVAAGVLILLDGMIWSELGSAFPGSGGSYLYLLEGFGKKSWGKLMAFLFIWQFMLSGPLEVASGLIAMSQFAAAIHPDIQSWNEQLTWKFALIEGTDLAWSISPSRLLAFALGAFLIFLLYRKVEILGKLTIVFSAGVLVAILWIIIDGILHFNHAGAFELAGTDWPGLGGFSSGLGQAMILAMYSYLGYYNICYVGDEVKDPGRTIPRSIFLCSVTVISLFLMVHIALTSVVDWKKIPVHPPEVDSFSLAAEFMKILHGEGAAILMTLFLVWSCLGAAFAALLGYSRIPYGAARKGHFFRGLARVHTTHQIPHFSLLLVGGLTLFWSFFDLGSVITALVTTRILEQFLGQIVALMLLRRNQPELERPYKVPFYPWPCLVASAGWLFLYFSAGWIFIALGLITLLFGGLFYFGWNKLESKKVIRID